jgi:hypothetical protein
MAIPIVVATRQRTSLQGITWGADTRAGAIGAVELQRNFDDAANAASGVS